MPSWIAVANGALDIKHWHENSTDVELMILPTIPSEPLGLQDEPALLWRKLCQGPINDLELTEYQYNLVREFEDAGIASTNQEHRARARKIDEPWLESPIHELIYSLVAQLSQELGVRTIFIKGPALQAQGLRSHHHSGDIDVWVEPTKIRILAKELKRWGWKVSDSLWEHVSTHHSSTMKPGAWGCELDLHRHMPGCNLPDDLLFELMMGSVEKMKFAGSLVDIPTNPVHAVIATLHLLRPSRQNTITEATLDQATRLLVLGGEEAANFADQAKAIASISIPAKNAFPYHRFSVDYEAPRNWTWRAQENRAKELVNGLKTVPWHERPRFIYRVIWPSRSDIVLSDKQAGRDGKRLFFARLKRFSRISKIFVP